MLVGVDGAVDRPEDSGRFVDTASFPAGDLYEVPPFDESIDGRVRGWPGDV